MPSSEQSQTKQDASRHRDAIAGLQERLAQFGRLVGEVRDGRPEQRAEALNRIEQGIAGLSELIAVFGQDGSRQARAPALSAPADVEDVWDPQSAEELMRAYEAAEAEFSRAGPQPTRSRVRDWPRATEAAGPQAVPAHDQAWLDTRLAGISTLLQHSLADIDPTASLAALDRRLDLFDQRLDRALSDMALGSDRGGMKLIDAHVTELSEHFEAIRQQLTRLDAMDAQLHELAHALEAAPQRSGGDAATLSEDAIVAIIDTASERAAGRVAGSMPADAGGQGRIDAIEGMLQDYVVERRRSEEATTSILRTIEDALVRIIDRVETMDAVGSASKVHADSDAAERDGMEVEHDRLAEAYAEGARVLGQQVPEPSLHAADYVTTDRREPREAARSPDEPAPQEEQTRQELRASVIRAKLRAQSAPQEPTPESAGLDEAKAGVLGHGRARSWTSAKAGSHRFSLLLGAAMALLFGAGFVGVNSFLTQAPLTGASQKATATHDGARATSLLPSEPRRGSVQPAAQPGNAGSASPSEQTVGPAPKLQPAPRRASPEAVTEDQSQSAPSRLIHGVQQTGSTITPSIGATPVMLAPSDRLGPTAPDAETGDDATSMTGSEAEMQAAVGTAKLRQAAVAGDASAQFEIAGRFAEGKDVAQDHKRAFVWYERAATRGLAAAQFRLAAYYERGIGVDVDKERAKVWYRRAADQGYVRAMHNLGVLTLGAGQGQSDYATAAGWFRQAAARGLADSQFNLAVLYENGRGVPKDLQEAYQWFALAARAGDAASARRLEQVKARLEPAEIDAAERKLATKQLVAAEPVANAATGTAR